MKKIVLGVLSILFLGAFLFPTTPALSQAVNDPLGLEYGAASGLGDQDVRTSTARIINVALSLLGIILLVLIVYSGFLWMTAAGNDEQISKAKKILASSVIGLVIILSAYSISRFVVTNLSDVTEVDRGPQ